jgi:LacI family transcriptional regulator
VGASIASRVLNDDPTVSIRPETRKRILTAARELDYRPNAFARGLKLARTMTFGMVIPNLAYPVNAEIIRGAERRAAAAGYVILLADAEEFEQAGEAFQRLLLERRVDGLLIASGGGADVLDRLQQQGLPFVLVNRRVPTVGPSVTADDALGMRMAVEHLVELGHSRIGHIAGPSDADTAQRRLAGFRYGLRAHGLRPAPNAVVEASLDEQAGYDAMRQLLELRARPTAVTVWSIAAAVGALAAARDEGVAVPEELSVVAFHDVPMAGYLDPPLTTIRMPLWEMAERSVECLLRLVDGEQVEDVVIATKPVLVERRSTAPPPAS